MRIVASSGSTSWGYSLESAGWASSSAAAVVWMTDVLGVAGTVAVAESPAPAVGEDVDDLVRMVRDRIDLVLGDHGEPEEAADDDERDHGVGDLERDVLVELARHLSVGRGGGSGSPRPEDQPPDDRRDDRARRPRIPPEVELGPGPGSSPRGRRRSSAPGSHQGRPHRRGSSADTTTCAAGVGTATSAVAGPGGRNGSGEGPPGDISEASSAAANSLSRAIPGSARLLLRSFLHAVNRLRTVVSARDSSPPAA